MNRREYESKRKRSAKFMESWVSAVSVDLARMLRLLDAYLHECAGIHVDGPRMKGVDTIREYFNAAYWLLCWAPIEIQAAIMLGSRIEKDAIVCQALREYGFYRADGRWQEL